MPTCDLCAGLFIEDLVRLAGTELYAEAYPRDSGDGFPKHAFYQHHASFHDLEVAAKDGCDLCTLILGRFHGTKLRTRGRPEARITWPFQWTGPQCDSNDCESIYAKVQELDTSDIKICIGSVYIGAGRRLEDVAVLDALVVKVGPFLEDTTRSGTRISPLHLLLTGPADDDIVVNGKCVGRRPLQPLNSPYNFRLARKWLNDCQKNHAHSAFDVQIPQLPTRVIDVGASDTSHTARLLQSKGERGHYVALSHCWGGAIPVSLRLNCLDAYQRELPFESFPANFQDAIAITRNLGIRYLWIDSLCIIQDSLEDWELESKTMCTLYRDAVVTICALTPEKSTDGIFAQEDVDDSTEGAFLNITPRTIPGDNRMVKVEPHLYNDDSELSIGGFLRTRGWTLQESILSRRKLLYGKRNIYFQCHEDTQSADGVPHSAPADKSPELERILHSPYARNDIDGEEKARILLGYLQVVSVYSMRELTVESDKLPAFSGFSQALHTAIGGDYLAGLWGADFNRGLLWQVVSQIPYSGPYRAPSWSWAASNSWLAFSDFLVAYFDTESGLHLRLLEAKVVPCAANNPFGEVLHAFALVEARAAPFLFIRPAGESNASGSNVVGILHLDQVPEIVNGYFERRTPIVLGSSGVYLEGHIKSDWGGEEIEGVGREDFHEHGKDVNDDGKFLAMLVSAHEENRRWFGGVLLKSSSNNGAYKRMGIFELQQDLREELQQWPLRTLKLI